MYKNQRRIKELTPYIPAVDIFRIYEKEPGSANAIHEKWEKICKKALEETGSTARFKKNINGIVHDFDTLPLLDIKKPRVGIVGEILVKFLPSANNHLKLLCRICLISSCTASTTVIINMNIWARHTKAQSSEMQPSRSLSI